MKFFSDFRKVKTVSLVTPKKGSKGDKCIESDAEKTSIPSILARYGGNLAAWRGDDRFEDTTTYPVDMLDAQRRIREAQDILCKIPNNPFNTLKDAFDAIKSGDFERLITEANKAPVVDSVPVSDNDNPVKE